MSEQYKQVRTVEQGKSSTNYTPLLISMCVTALLLFREDFLTALGLGWSLFLFLVFINKLGKSFPVLELMLLMSALQWIVGAWIAYENESDHWRYFMYVDEPEYMRLAVPGVIMFSIGIFIFFPSYSFEDMNIKLKHLVYTNGRIAYGLIFIGIISIYLAPYVPASLRFVLFLVSSFQYVGLALLLFKPNDRSKWLWFLGIVGFLTISSILKGMFHDLVLWSILLFSFVVIELDLGTKAKLVSIGLGLLFVVFLQSVKSQYRSLYYSLQGEEKVELFTDLMTEQAENLDVITEESSLSMLNVRLNQGWIISSIIDNIPRNEPFADGETILEAINASLVPRILDPNKKVAGGRENFRRFTGIGIRDNTSMGTSILGEAYGNYGYQGAWFFMLVWGMVLAMVFRLMINYGKKKPIILVFIPLIFLQVIKAETELYVVLNHFIKSLILVFGFLWFARKVLKWKV